MGAQVVEHMIIPPKEGGMVEMVEQMEKMADLDV